MYNGVHNFNSVGDKGIVLQYPIVIRVDTSRYHYLISSPIRHVLNCMWFSWETATWKSGLRHVTEMALK